MIIPIIGVKSSILHDATSQNTKGFAVTAVLPHAETHTHMHAHVPFPAPCLGPLFPSLSPPAILSSYIIPFTCSSNLLQVIFYDSLKYDPSGTQRGHNSTNRILLLEKCMWVRMMERDVANVARSGRPCHQS